MHACRVRHYKWYQSRLSTNLSVGPCHGLVQVGGLRGWQATAQGRAALKGVDCDTLESHIDYREESDWDLYVELSPLPCMTTFGGLRPT